MATNDIRMQNDFANLLRKKTPDLSDDEVRKCFDEIVKSIENYLKQYAFQSNINKPSQARKELSDLSLSIKTVINKIRILDGTSQAHLIRLGFKTLATQSTLSGLYELVKVAEKIANAKPNKVANHPLTYLVGRIHDLLGKMLSPHQEISTKLLVNDVFVLIAPQRLEHIEEIKKLNQSQYMSLKQCDIIPIDIGRHYDKAMKLMDFISD